MSAKISFKQTLFFYFKLTSIVVGAGYGYLSYKCYRTRRQTFDNGIINLKKDTTRPTNEYYGINWGYRADNTIEKSFNTGDLIFFNYKCDRCLYPSETLSWYAKSYFTTEEFSEVGFLFKTPGTLFVIFSHFGNLTIMPYSEFLNRPYVARVKARNFENPPIDISKRTIEFVRNLKELKNAAEPKVKSDRHSDKVGEFFKEEMVKKHLDKVVTLYYHYLGVLRVNPINKSYTPKDFDLDHPYIFHKDYELGKAFVIRTESTKDLKDNMNFK